MAHLSIARVGSLLARPTCATNELLHRWLAHLSEESIRPHNVYKLLSLLLCTLTKVPWLTWQPNIVMQLKDLHDRQYLAELLSNIHNGTIQPCLEGELANHLAEVNISLRSAIPQRNWHGQRVVRHEGGG